jgi:glycine/D-amino acid oxidase-like deaminating enzyme
MQRRDFLKFLSLVSLYSPTALTKNLNKKRITIVGAGIVGSSIAHELSRLGENVTLIDKSTPGSGTSGKSFNWINATYPKKPYSYNYLSQLGLDAYIDLKKHIDFPITWNGSLEWFLGSANQDNLIANVNNLLAYPTHSPHKIINNIQASEYEPNIKFMGNNNIVYSHSDGAIDATETIKNLVDKSIFNGAKVINNCALINLVHKNNKLVSINTSLGEIKSDLIILATGIDTNNLIHKKVLKKPTAGIIIKTKPYKKVINKIIVGPGIHIHQQDDGRLIIGEQDGAPLNHNDRLSGYPTKFPLKSFEDKHTNMIIDKAKSFIKNIDNIEIESVDIGWRPLPLDGLPVVGFTNNSYDTYAAVMHSGISIGPIIGKLVAQEITENIDSILLKDFRPSRF